MKQMRVIVTAAGAGPGVAIIKALCRMESEEPFVLAVDMSPDAAGLYLAHAWELVPASTSSGFIDQILELCRRYSINMVIPTFDTETPVFSAQRQRFQAEGIYVAVNPPQCIRNANDKALSFEVCQVAGLLQPQRFQSPAEAPAEAFPLLGKPLLGVGAKGIVHLATQDTLLPRGIAIEAYIWQRWLQGQEFSIDTFGAPDSERFVAVPRFRRLVKAGQMVKGHTCADPDLIGFARNICRAFGAVEVCCVQVIRSPDGALYFVEINPRYGTGVSLSIHAGVNFPRLQWLSAFAPEQVTPEMLQFKSGVEMIRYWEELYR
jgi:carbamoyl-phosphate synthase large subunit